VVVLREGDEVALLPPVSGGWEGEDEIQGLSPSTALRVRMTTV